MAAVPLACHGATLAAGVAAAALLTFERRPRATVASPVQPVTRASWLLVVVVAVVASTTSLVVREATLVTTP
jgi:hypothetical protein